MTTEAEKMQVLVEDLVDLCLAAGVSDAPLRALALRPDDPDLVAQVAIHYALAPTTAVCEALVEIARERSV